MQLLMMIVVPLVMVSIIQSIINLEKSSDLGKMSGWIIGFLVSTAMVAALVGIGSAAVFDLNASEIEAGQEEQDRGSMMESRLGDVEDMSTPEKILSFIPSNIFSGYDTGPAYFRDCNRYFFHDRRDSSSWTAQKETRRGRTVYERY